MLYTSSQPSSCGTVSCSQLETITRLLGKLWTHRLKLSIVRNTLPNHLSTCNCRWYTHVKKQKHLTDKEKPNTSTWISAESRSSFILHSKLSSYSTKEFHIKPKWGKQKTVFIISESISPSASILHYNCHQQGGYSNWAGVVITHADDSRGSNSFILVCLSVCPLSAW